MQAGSRGRTSLHRWVPGPGHRGWVSRETQPARLGPETQPAGAGSCLRTGLCWLGLPPLGCRFPLQAPPPPGAAAAARAALPRPPPAPPLCRGSSSATMRQHLMTGLLSSLLSSLSTATASAAVPSPPACPQGLIRTDTFVGAEGAASWSVCEDLQAPDGALSLHSSRGTVEAFSR
eukprot:COSAG01_NODE_3382_length_6164_cov_204.291838_4_plen_176_part_00